MKPRKKKKGNGKPEQQTRRLKLKERKRKKENPQKEIFLSSLYHAECSPVSGIIPTNYYTVVKPVVHWHSYTYTSQQFKKRLRDSRKRLTFFLTYIPCYNILKQ